MRVGGREGAEKTRGTLCTSTGLCRRIGYAYERIGDCLRPLRAAAHRHPSELPMWLCHRRCGALRSLQPCCLCMLSPGEDVGQPRGGCGEGRREKGGGGGGIKLGRLRGSRVRPEGCARCMVGRSRMRSSSTRSASLNASSSFGSCTRPRPFPPVSLRCAHRPIRTKPPGADGPCAAAVPLSRASSALGRSCAPDALRRKKKAKASGPPSGPRRAFA